MTNDNALDVQNNYVADLKNTHALCKMLMQTPHYKKMGEDGIFAIVETAKSLGIDPRLALSGGLYYVRGKVEMSSRMMAALIRKQKHSITRDSKSDDTICILHGRRADTKDCWTESFSIEEAKRAGLTKNPVWANFTRDMLYARALSRLARQLFPDIVGNVYVEGEIKDDPNISNADDSYYADTVQKEIITDEQHDTLVQVLDKLPDAREKVMRFLGHKDIHDLRDITSDLYPKILTSAKNQLKKQGDNSETLAD